MNWDAAIEKNREALKRVLAMLIAMAGLAGVDPKSPSPLWGSEGRARQVALPGKARGGGNRRVWPLRPGRPPGHRPANSGPRHEVHEILDVTHGLAFWALEKPDTS
jgi:hypothetical protein